MEKVIIESSNQYPVIFVGGPRQVGKTTMLKHLVDEEGINREAVTLDDLLERELAVSDPKMFFQMHKPPLLIDEVQYAPELFGYIKMIVDASGRYGDFWLTGSQFFSMIEGIQESLAGRVAVFDLLPLSYGEVIQDLNFSTFSLDLDYLLARQQSRAPVDTPTIYQRIFYGGMPSIVSGERDNIDLFYSSYLNTYLERDVRRVLGQVNIMSFLRFLRAIAARVGQQINYSDIANDVEISQSKVRSWLDILESLGIVFRLYPYSRNSVKKVVSSPKLYFYDTGLVCYLTRWTSPETAMVGAMSGALLEDYVVSEIVKTYRNAGKNLPIYYYCDSDSKEIDIVLEGDGKLYPIEIKKTATPSKKLVSVFSLLDVFSESDSSGPKRGTGAVICMADKVSAFSESDLVVPVYLI